MFRGKESIHGTNVHLWPFIVDARRNGAKLYVIDPVTTRTARLGDKHFAIYPGSDLALALGLMHVIIGEKLFDREYVEPEDRNRIRTAASQRNGAATDA